jgi:hypothetical protein
MLHGAEEHRSPRVDSSMCSSARLPVGAWWRLPLLGDERLLPCSSTAASLLHTPHWRPPPMCARWWWTSLPERARWSALLSQSVLVVVLFDFATAVQINSAGGGEINHTKFNRCERRHGRGLRCSPTSWRAAPIAEVAKEERRLRRQLSLRWCAPRCAAPVATMAREDGRFALSSPRTEVRMAILPMGTGTRGYRTRMGWVWAYFSTYGYYPYPTRQVMGRARV